MAGDARKFKELRFLFMRGLINHEKSQRSRHYLKSAAECTSRAIVSLELSPEAVTTVKQAKRLEGIGGETCTRLARLDEERNFSSLKPLYGRYVSSAAAILVSLLDMSEEILAQGLIKGKDILVPESRVKTRARQLCEEPFIEEGQEGFCVAWWRLEVLIKRGHIKRRSQKKISCLQLLPSGNEIANRLRGPRNLPAKQEAKAVPRENLQDKQELHPGLPHTTLTGNHSVLMETSLFTNDKGLDGVVLLVDIQEMGGERAGLGELCRLLEHNGVCYRTKKLPTGDYSWIWRFAGDEVPLPCLAERKRADDIPCTLKEGRFWSQINRMLDWKRGFTDRGIDCHIHYMLERKPEEYVVKCTDGCQGIGRCGNPTLAQIKMVIEDLKRHPELLVKETDSLEITAILLKSLTNELKERARKGEYDNLLTSTASHQDNKVKKEMDNFQHNLQKHKVETKIDNVRHALQAHKEEPEVDNSHYEPLMDLSFDEQLNIALENSLKDVKQDCVGVEKNVSSSEKVKHNEANRTNVAMTDNITHYRMNDTKTQKPNSSHTNHNTTSDVSAIDSGIFVNPSLSDRPLMQHHCTIEGSVTCPSQTDRQSNAGDSGNEYRPKINRKRSYNSSSPAVDTLMTTCPKQIHCESSINVQEKLSSQSQVQIMDSKTDEILESLRQNNKLTDVNITREVTVVEDEMLDKQDSYPPKRLKPIKLNLSPSKLYLETNIVMFKSESTRTGGKRKLGLKGTNENNLENPVCSEETIDTKQGMDSVINRVEGNCDLSENSKTVKLCETVFDNDTVSSKKDDNESMNSMEDIFADSPNPEPLEKTDIPAKETITHQCDSKVIEWLHVCNSPETDINTETTNIINQTTSSNYTSIKEKSNASLPDIDDFTIDPKYIDNESNIVHPESATSSDVIVLTEDSELLNAPGPSGLGRSCSRNSKRSKKNKRQRKDSGYGSGDVRHKTNSVDEDSTELDVKIDTVLAVLPHTKRYRIRRVLQTCGYNVEMCISLLLDEGDVKDEPGDVIDLT